MGEETNQEQVASPPRRSRAWIWWLVLLVGVLAVLGCAVALVFGWHEPKYSDKPLSYWLAELNGTNYIRRDIAADALAKIGEPALEPLKYALHKERSFVYELRDRVWKIAPLAIQQHIPKPWNVDDLQYNACVGIAAMGPQAAVLVPDLIQVLTNTSPAIQSRATFAMRKIGTNAYPALLAATTSTNVTLARASHGLLTQAGVQAPLGEQTKAKLRNMLSGVPATASDFSWLISQLNLSNVEAVNLLTPELAATNEATRLRTAILLAQLDRRSAAITALLVKGIAQAPAVDKSFCVTGLMRQQDYVKPHRSELERLIPQEVPVFTNSFPQFLEQQFGFNEAKWRSIEQMIVSDDAALQKSAAIMLQTGLGRYQDIERSLVGLRTLLTSTNEQVVLHVLVNSSRFRHRLQPEVEKLSTELKTRPETDPLRVQAERTLAAMKGLFGSGLPIRQPMPPRILPPSPPALPPTPPSFVVPASTNQPTNGTRQIPQRPNRARPNPPSVP